MPNEKVMHLNGSIIMDKDGKPLFFDNKFSIMQNIVNVVRTIYGSYWLFPLYGVNYRALSLFTFNDKLSIEQNVSMIVLNCINSDNINGMQSLNYIDANLDLEDGSIDIEISVILGNNEILTTNVEVNI